MKQINANVNDANANEVITAIVNPDLSMSLDKINASTPAIK